MLWVVAIPEPFLQQYLNEFARQMHQSPNPNEHPAIQRIAEARYRQMQMDRLRPPGGEESIGALLKGLGLLFGGGTSLALTGNPNPIKGVGSILGDFAAAKDRVMAPGGNPADEGLGFVWPGRGSLKGRPGDPAYNALHGADVSARVKAKRAAKGPRKPGGGRRPAPKPAPEPDLATQLALSLPKKTAAAVPVVAKRGAVSGILARLRGGRTRRGGR